MKIQSKAHQTEELEKHLDQKTIQIESLQEKTKDLVRLQRNLEEFKEQESWLRDEKSRLERLTEDLRTQISENQKRLLDQDEQITLLRIENNRQIQLQEQLVQS